MCVIVGMVLFYSTFVAMKRQDRHGVEHAGLHDQLELEGRSNETGEEVDFASPVKDGSMLHALRLWKDLGSRVVRLEASAARGHMKDVPIWTAFVTCYVERGDVDWAQLEGDGVVSLIALRPRPYVFLAGYEPPTNRKGEYILQFVDDRRMAVPYALSQQILTASQKLDCSSRTGLLFVVDR